MSNGYINYKWPFSIAMLTYQRVDSLLYDNDVILLFLNQRQTWIKSALKAVKTKKRLETIKGNSISNTDTRWGHLDS